MKIDPGQFFKRIVFFVLVAISILLLVGGILPGNSGQGILIPLGIIVGLFALGQGLAVYYTPRNIPETLIEQELSWLYGPEVSTQANLQQRALAQERIKQRRVRRRQYIIIMAPLLILGILFMLLFGSIFIKYAEPGGNILYLLAAGLALVLLIQGIKVFPINAMLARQERLVIQPVRRLPVPAWGWLFVIACGLIPVVTLGGLFPGALGAGSAAICYSVSRSDSIGPNTRIISCLLITLVAWVLLIILLQSVLGKSAF